MSADSIVDPGADAGAGAGAGLPARSAEMAFARWHDELEHHYGLRCERQRGLTSHVEMAAREMGDVRVADVRMSAQTLAPRCRTQAAEDQIYLKLVVSGHAMFEQNGEQRCFSADSLVLVDPSRPFVERVDHETRLIVVSCPKSALRDRGYRSEFNHWIAPDMRSPDAQFVRGIVCTAQGAVISDSAMQRRTSALLGTQLLDLLDVVMQVEPAPRGRTTEAVRFRVKRHIAGHLGDDTLDATAIARAAGLSVSQLNRLFRDEGVSPMRYVWQLRVERAASLLGSPQADTLRIEQLAWRCGFTSAAHFSRLFREQYGVTPKAFRERTRQSTS